jgi:hypothetical protein
MSSTARRIGCATLVVAVITLTAPTAGAAKTSDPKTAKAVAALLAAKKLDCRDFAAAGTSALGSSTLPSSLSQLAPLLLQGADLGTCTVGGLRTLLVAFRNTRARQSFASTLAALPCALVKSALSSASAPTGSTTTGNITLPYVDLGSRAIAFSTGSAPDNGGLDLTRATTADSSIASKAKGKLRTLTYQCA